MKGHKVKCPDDHAWMSRMLLICKSLNWDYYTYMKQPDWFIDGIWSMHVIDTEVKSEKNKTSMSKHQRGQVINEYKAHG